MIELPENSWHALYKAMSLLIVGICFLALGCEGTQTIWSAEIRSPDGHWLAIARTIQHFGPGAAGIETVVYLKWDSQHPRKVLLLFHDERNKSRLINLTMKWASSSHLEVSYTGRATVDIQTVKFGGVDISVRDLSTTAVTTSR